jgi:hypothetical protein
LELAQKVGRPQVHGHIMPPAGSGMVLWDSSSDGPDRRSWSLPRRTEVRMHAGQRTRLTQTIHVAIVLCPRERFPGMRANLSRRFPPLATASLAWSHFLTDVVGRKCHESFNSGGRIRFGGGT